jgi:hypothetical protein
VRPGADRSSRDARAGALAAVLIGLALVCPGATRAGAGPPAAGIPAQGSAGPLDGRIVRRIDLVTRTIFEPLPPRGGALYSAANRLHVRTRAATLRASLTVREGDRWSEMRRAESERHLRSLAYVVPDTVAAIAVGEDSVDVRVVTHDNWTTSPEFSVESGGGQRFGSVSLSERNFLGLGTSLSLAYRSDVTGISRVARIDDGELFGSHWQGRVTYGSNDGGSSRSILLALPFWSDEAPLSLTGWWAREAFNEDLFANGQLVATVPVMARSADLVWGRGHRTARGTIVRVLGSFEQRDRDLGGVVVRGDAPASFGGPPERLHIRRLGAELQVTKPHYRVVRGVDHMDRDEDFDLGPLVAVKAGFAPKAFGSSADEANTRLRMGLGREAGRWGFGWLSGLTQARLRPRVNEAYSQMSGEWVQQPRRDMAAVVAVTGISGWNAQRDFQVTLGGITGLRGFPVHELTGTRAWRGNAELRWIGVRDWLRLVSLGGAAFWDAGRTYGPGATDLSWRQDVGFGLRLSLPHSAVNEVARFDVAWPVAPARAGRRGPAYSFGSGQAF